MFDYEWATVQHNVNCRLARAVVVPDAIPPQRLARYGAAGKIRAYEGLKEEYYLADFEPRRRRARGAGARPRAPDRAWCARRPRSRCITASRTTCSRRCCAACREAAAERGTQTVVLPRVERQREELRQAGGFISPRARHRRPVADRARRPRDLRRRDHEPRGRGAGHARLHDLSGPPGGGRRAAHRRRPPARARRTRESSIWASRERTDAPPRVRRDPRVLVELLLCPLRSRDPQRLSGGSGRGGRLQSPQCADGSARRPSRSTVTRCRS